MPVARATSAGVWGGLSMDFAQLHEDFELSTERQHCRNSLIGRLLIIVFQSRKRWQVVAVLALLLGGLHPLDDGQNVALRLWR